MIPVDSLLYKIDQKLNKLSTNEHQQIQLEDKILALNEAQIKLIKQKVDGFAIPNKLGFDAFKKRYEDLQNLVIDFINQPLSLVETNKELHQWDADLTVLKPKYELIKNHTARRSFCTNAYIAGMPTLDIMAISGHSSEKSFLNYIKITADERALKIAENSFFNPKKQKK